jgi:hypothetical protein
MNFSQIQNDWWKINIREKKFYSGFISLDEGGQGHGGLAQEGGSHGLKNLQQCNVPCTLPIRAPTTTTRNITNFKNIFNGVSIITKLYMFCFQRKTKFILSYNLYLFIGKARVLFVKYYD